MRGAAIDAVIAALETADIHITDVTSGDGRVPPTIAAMVDDRPLRLAVYAMAYCTAQRARELLVQQAPGAAGVWPIVVAERITRDARAMLSEAQWSWLDRRGRLHIRGPAIRVDADVPSRAVTDRSPVQARPITGRSGRAVAYWLCAHPNDSLSPTRDAAELGLAPSTISVTVQRLAAAGLVAEDGTGVFPELFWELAAVWRPERTWLASAPSPPAARPDSAVGQSWRRTGTSAAAAYGAPVVTAGREVLELYVPAPVDVSIAVRRYGAAQPGLGAAVVAVVPARSILAPVPQEVAEVGGWPAAPLTAVALDLAQDRARGRQMLEEWRIGDGVWR